MLELKPVTFSDIQQWAVDFQKKSHCFEMPTDNAVFSGIFDGPRMVGYFVLGEYQDGTLEIQQGYLTKEARHLGYEYRAMRKLEEQAKQLGFTNIILQAQRSMKAYNKFMERLGFSPKRIVFSKEL